MEKKGLLNEQERNSSAWRKIRQYLLVELLKLRERNDAKLSLEETTALRGNIHRIKIILEMAEGGIFWEELKSPVYEEDSIKF